MSSNGVHLDTMIAGASSFHFVMMVLRRDIPPLTVIYVRTILLFIDVYRKRTYMFSFIPLYISIIKLLVYDSISNETMLDSELNKYQHKSHNDNPIQQIQITNEFWR